jgi:hypothetical protein
MWARSVFATIDVFETNDRARASRQPQLAWVCALTMMIAGFGVTSRMMLAQASTRPSPASRCHGDGIQA